MKLRTKLLTIFTLAILMIGIAILSEQVASSKNTQQFEASKKRYLSFVLADEFRHTSMDLTRLARSFVATAQPKYWDAYWDIVKWRSGEKSRPNSVNQALYPGQYKKQTDIMHELNFSAKEFALLNRASQQSNALIKTEEQAMKTVREGRIATGSFSPEQGESANSFALRIVFDDNYHGEVAKIMAPVDAFFSEIDHRTAAELNNANKAASFWMALALISQIIAGLIVGLVIVYTVIRVFNPLDKVVSAMQDIGNGQGDLSSRLEERGNDELTALAKGFNRFADNIQHLVDQVRTSVDEISVASTQLNTTADETERAVLQQKVEIDQVSRATSEMVATVKEITTNASAAATAANETDNEAAQGQVIVTQAITSINQLTDEMQHAFDAILQVEQDSNTITTVLDVIRGIADQTNLLALNAAIEAARAGEQGRGFAVVADEVRTLSQRTQASTQEIQSMIERLQKSATTAVNRMGTSRDQAENCVAHTSQTGDSLSQITDSVTAITERNFLIATASEQQSVVIGDISNNIDKILDMVEQTSRGSQQTASSSEDLTRLSDQLQRLVGQFKTR